MTSADLVLAAGAAAAAVLAWPLGRQPAAGGRRPAWRHRPPGNEWSRPPAGVAAAVPVAVLIELVAAALAGGLSPAEAVGAAVRAAGPGAGPELQQVVDSLRLGVGAEVAWERAGPAYAGLARTLVLAERTGASAATALRRTAMDERAARRRRAQLAARRLGVHLVLPLGLATLPSFVLLAVVPVVVGLAQQFLTG